MGFIQKCLLLSIEFECLVCAQISWSIGACRRHFHGTCKKREYESDQYKLLFHMMFNFKGCSLSNYNAKIPAMQ